MTFGKAFLHAGGVGLFSLCFAANTSYIADEAAHVYVLDVLTNTVTGTVSNTSGTPFEAPFSVAIDQTGTFAYLTDVTGADVFYIDAATNTATSTVTNIGPPFINPTSVSISPNSTFAYVADRGSHTIYHINVGTNTADFTLPDTSGTGYGEPFSVMISPNGSFAYATDLTNTVVFHINTATNTTDSTIANTSGIPFSSLGTVAFNPTGAFAYVTDAGNHAVYFVNTATNTATATLNNTSGTPFGAPEGIAFSPTENLAYVTDVTANTVFVINTLTNTAVATISNISGTAFSEPTNIAFTEDGSEAFITDGSAHTVFVIDTATNTAISTLANTSGVPYGAPAGIAIHAARPIPPPPPPPPPSTICTTGLSGNNLKLANYLNKNAPTTIVGLFAPLGCGGALSRALESAAPTRNAYTTYMTQNAALTLSQVVNDHLRQQRFHTMHLISTPQQAAVDPADFRNIDMLTAEISDKRFEDRFIGDGTPQEIRSSQPSEKTCAYQPFTAWLGAFGEYAHQKAQSQTPSLDAGLGGAIAAFDYNGTNGDVVGGGLAYSYTHLHEEKSAGKANINQGYATLYGTAYAGLWYFDVAFWGGYYHSDNTRSISFPKFDANAKSDIHGWQFNPHLEIGYDGFRLHRCDVKKFGIEPFAMADWVNCWEDSFKEHGGHGLSMGQKSRHCSLLRIESGLRLDEVVEFNWGKVVFFEKGSYAYRKAFHTGHITAFLVGSPGSFTVSTLGGAQNLGVAELAVLFATNNKTYCTIAYQGEFGSKYQSHQGQLSIGRDF